MPLRERRTPPRTTSFTTSSPSTRSTRSTIAPSARKISSPGPTQRASSGIVVETRCRRHRRPPSRSSVKSPTGRELDLVARDGPAAHLRTGQIDEHADDAVRARPPCRAPSAGALGVHVDGCRARRSGARRRRPRPAARASVSAVEVAGPTVATIFVRRIRPRTITRVRSERGPHPRSRAFATRRARRAARGAGAAAAVRSRPRAARRPRAGRRERRPRRHRRLRRGLRSGEQDRDVGALPAARTARGAHRRSVPRRSACAGRRRRSAQDGAAGKRARSTTSACASNGEVAAYLGTRLEPRRPRRASAVAVDGLDARCRRARSSRSPACTRPRPSAAPSRTRISNAVVAIDTALDPHALLALAPGRSNAPRAACGVERWGPRTLDVDSCSTTTCTSTTPDLTVPHPRMWERGFVLAPLRDVAPDARRRRCDVGGGTRRGGRHCATHGANDNAPLALIGPGRAGTTIALGLLEQGWTVGRRRGPRARRGVDRRPRPRRSPVGPTLVSRRRAGRGARDRRHPRPRDRTGRHDRRAVDRTGRARGAPRGLARARRVRRAARQSHRTCASARCIRCSRSRRRRSGSNACAGSWAAVAGDPEVAELAYSLGMQTFELADADRIAYHTAAVGRVEPSGRAARTGRAARRDVRRAVRGVRPARARVGAERVRARPGRGADRSGRARRPQHRRAAPGDRSTPGERDAYRALAREAARLTGRRDTGLDRLLDDLRHGRQRRRRIVRARPGPCAGAPATI